MAAAAVKATLPTPLFHTSLHTPMLSIKKGGVGVIFVSADKTINFLVLEYLKDETLFTFNLCDLARRTSAEVTDETREGARIAKALFSYAFPPGIPPKTFVSTLLKLVPLIVNCAIFTPNLDAVLLESDMPAPHHFDQYFVRPEVVDGKPLVELLAYIDRLAVFFQNFRKFLSHALPRNAEFFTWPPGHFLFKTLPYAMPWFPHQNQALYTSTIARLMQGEGIKFIFPPQE